MFEHDFLSELTLLETPKKDASGDILFATYYHLGDNYNVYAMANDLPEIMTYNEAVNYIEEPNKKTKQDWLIPTKDILLKMYDMRDMGDFKDTFRTKRNGTDGAHWYWSSTGLRDVSDSVFVVVFSDGVDVWLRKDDCRLCCRPCRAELIV
jgi:hypothetical protein